MQYTAHTDSYSTLARRVQALVTTPRARIEQQAVIPRLPDDHSADWERLLDEIDTTDGVRAIPRPDGSLYVAWFAQPREY